MFFSFSSNKICKHANGMSQLTLLENYLQPIIIFIFEMDTTGRRVQATLANYQALPSFIRQGRMQLMKKIYKHLKSSNTIQKTWFQLIVLTVSPLFSVKNMPLFKHIVQLQFLSLADLRVSLSVSLPPCFCILVIN